MPLSGKSLPIALDFSSCLPLSDVTITAHIDGNSKSNETDELFFANNS